MGQGSYQNRRHYRATCSARSSSQPPLLRPPPRAAWFRRHRALRVRAISAVALRRYTGSVHATLTVTHRPNHRRVSVGRRSQKVAHVTAHQCQAAQSRARRILRLRGIRVHEITVHFTIRLSCCDIANQVAVVLERLQSDLITTAAHAGGAIIMQGQSHYLDTPLPSQRRCTIGPRPSA